MGGGLGVARNESEAMRRYAVGEWGGEWVSGRVSGWVGEWVGG